MSWPLMAPWKWHCRLPFTPWMEYNLLISQFCQVWIDIIPWKTEHFKTFHQRRVLKQLNILKFQDQISISAISCLINEREEVSAAMLQSLYLNVPCLIFLENFNFDTGIILSSKLKHNTTQIHKLSDSICYHLESI